MLIYLAIESKPVDKRRYSNIDQPRLPRQKSDEVCYEKGMAYLEDMQMTLTSPRHYLRRRALVQEELQDDIKSPAVLRSANVRGVVSGRSSRREIWVRLVWEGLYQITVAGKPAS